MITIQRRIGLACLLVLGVFAVWAQSEAQTGAELRKSAPFPIFSYGENTVYSDEFLRVFNKNKKDKIAPTRLEIEEYLDLYIKFKLKVQEAYTRQMDTVPSFIRELSGYREVATELPMARYSCPFKKIMTPLTLANNAIHMSPRLIHGKKAGSRLFQLKSLPPSSMKPSHTP